jgi:L,D-transpeptidase ErfK/SrfK
LNKAISDEMWQQIKEHNVAVNLDLVNQLVAEPRGIAVPVSHPEVTLDSFLFASRHVENKLPEGANWNGSDETFFTAEQFEAARAGTPQPKKAPSKSAKKTVAAGSAAASAGSL